MKIIVDKQYILRLATNKEVAQRGIDYYSRGRVISVEADENDCSVHGLVRGRFDEYSVNIRFSVEGIPEKTSCDCPASVWGGACKHVIAVLLYLHAEHRDRNLAEKNSRMASNLLEMLEKETYGYIDNIVLSEDGENRISVVPEIGFDSDGKIYMILTVGRKRQYLVKNVEAFLKAFEAGKVISYGKGLEFEHNLDMLDERSRTIVEFLQKELKNKAAVFKERCAYMSGTGADLLFDIAVNLFGGKMQSSYQYYSEIYFGENQPEIKFEIKSGVGGELELFTKPELPEFFEGYNHNYLLEQNWLRRLSPEIFQTLEPLVSLIRKLGKNGVTFPKNEHGRFVNLLYPKLRDNDLLSASALSAFETDGGAAGPESKIFADSQNGNVLLRLLFCYGNAEINPLLDKNREGLQRNIYKEYRILGAIRRCGFLPDEKSGRFVLTNDDLIYSFIHGDAGLKLLNDISELYLSESFGSIRVKRRASAGFGIRISGNLLALDIDTDGLDREELLSVLYGYDLKKKYVRLKDGSFLNLEENEGLGQAAALISNLGLSEDEIESGKAYIPKYRAPALNDAEHINVTEGKEIVKAVAEEIATFGDKTFSAPAELENTLRSYQKDGFSWLKELSHFGFGGILADDMGLGKTLQIISLLLSEKDEGRMSIVVAPTSLIYNWEKEIQRFAPSLSCSIIAGTAEKRRQKLEECEAVDVLITTYDTLKRDIDSYEQFSLRYIIADEAQAIKNPSTQNAKAVKQLNGEIKFALTGTPVQNSVSELWSIFDFIMPNYLYDAEKFSKRFEQPIIKNGDRHAASELRRRVSPFILRRVKSDVLKELPDKIETTLYAEMTDEQKKLYTAYFVNAKGIIDEAAREGGLNKRRMDILAQLTRLRQICCHPSVFINDYDGGSGKLDLVLSLLKDLIAGEHRTLIFSQFTSMLDIIKIGLDNAQISYFCIEGSTDAKERLEMTERFNAGEKNVFLISLKAGGTGLNLTGADTVIHYDPWWNPAVMDQATDRAHRFGQKNTVHVINVVAKDSIEERMLKLQAKKKDLIDSIIQEGATNLLKMTKDEILELFE